MAMSRERMMGAWLAPIKSDYDYVIVDCAPTLGIIPINALAAADSVLIPVSAEHLPASGMTGLLKTVVRVRRQIRAGAAELADLAEVPCIVREMTEGEAIIAMVDSNLQRESILPSEAPSRTP